MPPRYVKTIEEEIFYEYAKLISRSAFGKVNYQFVSNRFKALCSGEIEMSGTIREWEKESELAKACVFCGSTQNLHRDHLIPRSRGGSDSADNMVWSCSVCNQARGNKGIFEWLGLKGKEAIPRIVAGKYLKELYELHKINDSLKITQEQLHEQCEACKNTKACDTSDTVGKLTSYCLESIF
jgi:hypothetical protein